MAGKARAIYRVLGGDGEGVAGGNGINGHH
jgi:hypothetical protein